MAGSHDSFRKKVATNMQKLRFTSLLNGLTVVLRKEKLSKQEYLLWSKKLEEIRKEVEAG